MGRRLRYRTRRPVAVPLFTEPSDSSDHDETDDLYTDREGKDDILDSCQAESSMPAQLRSDFESSELGAYYRRREETFDQSGMTQMPYSDSFSQSLHSMETYWKKYCKLTQKEDYKQTLIKWETAVIASFFDWLLRSRQGSIRSAGTLQTYYNNLTAIYKNYTHRDMYDPKVKQQMHAVRKQLVAEFNLKTEKKPKPIVRAEDEFELLKTLWSTSDLYFPHERQRLQLALFIQLAGITGNRPQAILNLRYKHVKVSLHHNPLGPDRPARVLVELSFKETKGYLGHKETNNFGVPDIEEEDCLLLCPHVTMLALVMSDKAFAHEKVNSPETLFQLRPRAGVNQLLLHWREDIQDQPIFRDTKKSANGHEVSTTTAATYPWLNQRLKQLGVKTGFELPVGPYCFRRGNGEALDTSKDISEAQRNLILGHKNSEIFTKNYLSRNVTVDVQAAYRGLIPQTEIMRKATGMSRTIDLRRPQKLSGEQAADVANHPSLITLKQERDRLREALRATHTTINQARRANDDRIASYDKASKAAEALQRRLERDRLALEKQLHSTISSYQDIDAQLGAVTDDKVGTSVAGPGEAEQPSTSPLSESRQCVVDGLLALIPKSNVDTRTRRVAAINAIIYLSGFQERPPVRSTILRPRGLVASASHMNHSPLEPKHDFPIKCHELQCIFCLGNRRLTDPQRRKGFHSRGNLRRHWMDSHLRFITGEASIPCPHPACDTRLCHKDHLRNHAERVHGTPT